MKRIVLFVTTEGTAMTFYQGYLRFLSEKGWDVVIVTKSNGPLREWAESEGATAYSLEFKRNPSLLHDVKALLSTYLLLRKLQPQVIVSATPKAGLLGTLAGKLTKIPVRIYQLWGLRLETETGLKRRILAGLERITIAASTQCVANSRSLARTTEALGLAPTGSIPVLGQGSSHGVNLQRFSPSTVPDLEPQTENFLRQKKELTIAFVGRLTSDKGVETLIDAVKLAREEGVSVRALLVGALEDDNTARQIAQVPDYFCTTGKVEDVRPYISAADVLCLPTLREGFPNVVLEAAALNVPAIVTDATGAIDSVLDGETGWVFPVGDSRALASIICGISGRHDLLLERGARARERVEKEFEQTYMWSLQVQNIEGQLKLYDASLNTEG